MNKNEVNELFAAIEDLWLYRQALKDQLGQHGLPAGEDLAAPYRNDPQWRAAAQREFAKYRASAEKGASVLSMLPPWFLAGWKGSTPPIQSPPVQSPPAQTSGRGRNEAA